MTEESRVHTYLESPTLTLGGSKAVFVIVKGRVYAFESLDIEEVLYKNCLFLARITKSISGVFLVVPGRSSLQTLGTERASEEIIASFLARRMP